MARQRKYTDEQLRQAVKGSNSIRQVLIKLGLSSTGGNYTFIPELIEKLNLDTTHFKGQSYLKNKTHSWAKKIPLENLLCKNSQHRMTIKQKNRLIKIGILQNQCYICKMKPQWQNKPLVLHMDHINGDTKDHRQENLRLLCPNCHSQTPTYCGRNKQKT